MVQSFCLSLRNSSNHSENNGESPHLTWMMQFMAHFPWEENVQRIGDVVVYIIKSDNIGQELEIFQFRQVQKKFRTLGLRSLSRTKSNDNCSEGRK